MKKILFYLLPGFLNFSSFNSIILSRRFFKYLFIGWMLLFSIKLMANTAPGITSGEFSVNQNGGSNYTVPLRVPPGTSGMHPTLSLNYSSHSGQGLSGLGWSLGGLSQVTRCPATKEQDGIIDGVDFDNNDRFCLDGQRLIAIQGNYGADGTEYRTEVDSQSKVISYDLNSSNNGPEYFKVWTKSGQIMEYGFTDDSRIESTNSQDVRLWFINKISDTANNYLTFTYHEDREQGESYPLAIHYTGNDNTGLLPYNTVRFIYETRAHPIISFVSGGKVQATQLLSKIQMEVDSDFTWEYRLSYLDQTLQPQLSTIEECDHQGLCFSPLQFTWQDQGSGFHNQELWFEANGGNQNLPVKRYQYGVQNTLIDMNGDGLADHVAFHNYDVDQGGLWVSLNNGAGFEGQVLWHSGGPNNTDNLPTAVSGSHNSVTATLRDMNGDGLPDRINYRHAQTLEQGMWVALNNGHGFDAQANWWADTANGQHLVENRYQNGVKNTLIDMNGDGLADHVAFYNYATNQGGLWVALNNRTGFEEQVLWFNGGPLHTDNLPTAITGSYDNVTATLRDMNSDGLPDRINYRHAQTLEQGMWVALNNGHGFDAQANWWADTANGQHLIENRYQNGVKNTLIDMNGDGLADHVAFYNYATNQGGLWVALNNGTGFEEQALWFNGGPLHTDNLPTAIAGSYDSVTATLRDMNGDGLPDRINYRHAQTLEQVMWVALNTGSGFSDQVKIWDSTSGNQHMPQYNIDVYGSTSNMLLDINGDGAADHVAHYNYDIGQAGLWIAANKMNPPLITAITNGLDATTQVEHRPLTQADIHTKSTNAAYPNIDIQGPIYVVSSVKVDDGLGGVRETSYTYAGAKVGLSGRGFLGFASMNATDQVTGIKTVTYYHQDFPYTGQVYHTEQQKSDGGLLGETDFTFAERISYGDKVHFPYISFSTDKRYDFDSEALVTSTTTSNIYDAYGNPTDIVVTTSGDPWNETKTTTNFYINDTVNWHLSRLMRASVIHSNAQGTETRTSSFAYNGNGLLIQEVVEPDSASLRQQTDYQYDGFGNKTSVTVSGTGVESRSSTTLYDARGQFPLTSSNALGHTESRTYDPKFGVMISLTGPNDLTTSWEYDGFGRKVREDRADGNWTTIGRGLCDGSCPAEAPIGTKLYKVTQSAGASPVSEYSDKLGRKIRIHTIGFDGRNIFQDTQYNALGQVVRISRKYYEGETQYWIRYEYDDIGRVIKESMPTESDPEATSGTNDTLRSYSGLSVTEINSLGQTTTRTKDQAGKLFQVTDSDYNTTTYKHSPTGNLLNTTDPAGNVVSITYNIRGWKMAMSDPDMGDWSYQYNVFGELGSQTDAKGQVTSMVYDKLGRMTSRTDDAGTGNAQTSTWAYDTATKGIGKIVTVTGLNGYLKTHSYDNLGRSSSTTTTIAGQAYTQSITYDAYGRTQTTAAPTGFGVKNIYNAQGYLAEVRNSSTNTLYWQADGLDAHGNAFATTLGNGLETTHAYDNAQGYLKAIMTGGNGQVQLLSYQFDNLGNLTQRQDLNQGLTEDFLYDGLNRLTQSDVTGGASQIAKTLDYDALGNITYKSDVGSYLYGEGGAGPHAVTTAGSDGYQYDTNGNMINGGGRVLTWSSFNKPLQITKGDAVASFEYDAAHNRTRQISSKVMGSQTQVTTTTYLGKGYERIETHTGVIEHKHYINVAGAMVLYTERSNSVNDTRYLHKDHLGSIDVITDELGQVVERQSFDAWGARRTTNWQSALESFISSVTTRGFTGHEQLDTVGLVHMNGRIYDAKLGRFLSADPNVQAPANPQSLNRYTYVNNNPLSYTDPSGYFFKKLFKKVKNFVKKYGRTILAIAAGALTGVGAMLVMGLEISAAAFAGMTMLQATAVGAAGGFASGLVATGSIKGALRGAVFGGISAGLAYGIGGMDFSVFNDIAGFAKDIAHGVVQGGLAEAFSGEFKSGFFGAFVGHTVGRNIMPHAQQVGVVGRTAIAAVAGGTAARMGDGKFANGAVSAAFAHLFNAETHAARKKLTNPTGGGIRSDSEGDGSFDAPRGSRKHLGVDLAATTGQDIVSPVDGVAINFKGATTGYPIVDIIPPNLSLGIDKVRLLYVDAPSGVSSWNSYSVSAGQSIGSAANLQSLGYSSGVTPHIHVQVMSDGNWVDPTPYFFGP